MTVPHRIATRPLIGAAPRRASKGVAIAMSKTAVGAYLKYLRERRKLTQEDIATHLQQAIGTETNIKQVYRWEKGQTTPAADALAAFTAFVGGNPVHVQQLMLNPQATETDGADLARQHYQQQEISAIAQNIPPEQLTEVSRLLARLSELMPGISDLLRERQ